jgi:hypothetical protein
LLKLTETATPNNHKASRIPLETMASSVALTVASSTCARKWCQLFHPICGATTTVMSSAQRLEQAQRSFVYDKKAKLHVFSEAPQDCGELQYLYVN